MRTRSQFAWLVLLAACGGDAARMLGPTGYDVSGEWLFSESLVNTGLAISCADDGLMTVTQDGPRFTAQGTQSGACFGPGGTQGFTNVAFGVANGEIDGNHITFRVDNCPYTGTAFGTAPDSLTGTVTCTLSVQGTRVTLRGQWRVVPPPDLTPPTVIGNTLGGGANGTLETGDDTLYFRIHATDDKKLSTMGYELTDPSRGAVVRRDSVLVSDTVAEDTLIFALPLYLPLPVPDGTPFHASLFARDSAGNTSTAPLDSVTVRYPNPPHVTGALAGVTNDSVGALRDTLQISVTVSSPRPLTWYGYRITTFVGQGDSIATTDTSGTHVFRVPVPFSWKGLLLTFEVFARDRLGLDDGGSLPNVRVVVFPSRPTQIFHVNQGVADVAYDDVRNRVYLATAVDSGPTTGSPEVRVFQISPAGFLPGIPLPWASNGLDVSPGGDSLLVSLFNNRLGIINLTTLASDSTAPLAFTPGNGRFAFRVRALGNNKAMVSIASANGGSGSPGQLVEVDLTTGVQTLRTDLGTAGGIGLTPLLARTLDRKRLLVFPSQPTAVEAQLYAAESDQFTASVAVPAPAFGGMSGDSTGTLWLVGNSLLRSDLASLRLLGSAQPQVVASALTSDGALAYVAVPEGVAKYRTSDGVELERILLPDPPYIMLITAGGGTMIAIASQGLVMVDLR
jgi:hypothetical protein